jgi:hypothetical protein
MIQPRYSRLSALSKKTLISQNLPTGNDFGGSKLQTTQPQELVFSIVTDSVSVSDYTIPIKIEQPSPLVVEVGKIVIVAIWFWCLIGANFCFDSVSNILDYGARDI